MLCAGPKRSKIRPGCERSLWRLSLEDRYWPGAAPSAIGASVRSRADCRHPVKRRPSGRSRPIIDSRLSGFHQGIWHFRLHLPHLCRGCASRDVIYFTLRRRPAANLARSGPGTQIARDNQAIKSARKTETAKCSAYSNSHGVSTSGPIIPGALPGKKRCGRLRSRSSPRGRIPRLSNRRWTLGDPCPTN